MAPPDNRAAWSKLQAHHAEIRATHLRELFAADPERGTTLTAEGAGVFLDYSKNRITGETVRLLLELAAASGLRERIDAMSCTSRYARRATP
jgi:glucose-6-phosphate isomerase